MAEIWKEVAGYEGYYKVSSHGRILNTRSGKLLRQTLSNSGYRSVALFKDGIHKDFRVHRLVAYAFIPNPRGLEELNHIDEDKLNNHVENLEWCSHRYNCNYGSRIGRIVDKRSVPVEQLDNDGNVLHVWKSMADAGRNGYSMQMVSACCTGRKKTHKGCRWRYA